MGTPNGPDILTLSYVDMGTRQVPPPEAQIWRFMDLAKLVTMLDRQALYFPVLAALDDKLEGALPRVPPDATCWGVGGHATSPGVTRLRLCYVLAPLGRAPGALGPASRRPVPFRRAG